MSMKGETEMEILLKLTIMEDKLDGLARRVDRGIHLLSIILSLLIGIVGIGRLEGLPSNSSSEVVTTSSWTTNYRANQAGRPRK